MTSDKKPSPLLKLRTFAHDLNTVRGQHPNPSPTEEKIVVKKPVVTKTVSKPKATTVPNAVVTDYPTSKKPVTRTMSMDKTALVNLPAEAQPATKTKIPTPILKNSLQESVGKINTASSKSATVSSQDKYSNQIRDNSYEAIIITDTKSNRFKFNQEVISGLKSWWNKLLKNRAESRKPKYTVPRADRRKGIIQQATTKTAKASTADYSAVLERVKANQNKLAITNENNEEKISPTTNDDGPIIGYQSTQPELSETVDPISSALNETERPASVIDLKADIDLEIGLVKPIVPTIPIPTPNEPVIAEYEKTELEKSEPIIPTIPIPTLIKPTASSFDERELEPEPITPNIPVQPKINPIVEFRTETNIVEPEPVIIPPTPIEPITFNRIEPVIPLIPTKPETQPGIETSNLTESMATELEPPADLTIDEIPVEVINTDFRELTKARVVAASKPRRSFRLANVPLLGSLIERPNRLVLVTLSLITVVFIIYIVSLNFSTEPSPTVTNNTSGQVIFNGSTRYQVDFIATSKQTLFDQIKSHQDETTTLFEVSFVTPDKLEPIPATSILDLLEVNLPVDFIASVNNITFGYYRGEPWLVLKISNKNTAYGGMLNWESSLSKNLDPWFGLVVRNSGGNNFRDGMIGTTDIRVLQDSDGRERITYGFVKNNTIVITTNTTAFLNLKNNLSN